MADLTGMMQAAAGSAGGGLLVQDVFSTTLYTGNSSTQTITNGIDLDGEGGLVWIKNRASIRNHTLFDTERGVEQVIKSSTSDASAFLVNSLTAFTSTGFSLGSSVETNTTDTYVSWTFRKAPKFFDVGTYTGNGSTQAVSHNLGSAPGFVIVKNLTTSGSWICWHRSLTSGYYMILNSTAAEDNLNAARRFGNNSTTVNPNASTITVGDLINTIGDTWVYYAFAHDAGGFGADENIITCESFATDGSGNATVTLGYEPQWLMTKPKDTVEGWRIYDTARGWGATDRELLANSSAAEQVANIGAPTSTGFTIVNYTSSKNFIFIACRADM